MIVQPPQTKTAKYALAWHCAACDARKWQELLNGRLPDVMHIPKDCERCGKPLGEAKDE